MKNNPHWCIWTSSYDRGLQNLLELWPDVIKKVPDAELHIFYGWQLFENFHRKNPERMAWMKRMNELMTQKGITHHGRVPQPEIEKWYKKCGIFAYPSHFYEINCISVIKAQLWGAVPVTTGYAALEETQKFGVKVEGEIYDNVGLSPKLKKGYTKALVKALRDEKWQEEQREPMSTWVREKYNWSKVASAWSKEFNK